MTTLIGLNGRRGSGKDTAFGYLREWATERGLSAHRRGFADSLKLSFSRLFIPNISLEEAVLWCDELKMPPSSSMDSLLTIAWGHVDRHGTNTRIQHSINGRQALQRYGTEGHRDVFGDDFWVDALLPANLNVDRPWPYNFRGPLTAEPPDIAVITDVRFPNEAERVRQLGGQIWRIDRGGDLNDFHASEQDLPEDLVNVTIYNDGLLEYLERIVRETAEERIAR